VEGGDNDRGGYRDQEDECADPEDSAPDAFSDFSSRHHPDGT
jgi:hypothetical protein